MKRKPNDTYTGVSLETILIDAITSGRRDPLHKRSPLASATTTCHKYVTIRTIPKGRARPLTCKNADIVFPNLSDRYW